MTLPPGVLGTLPTVVGLLISNGARPDAGCRGYGLVGVDAACREYAEMLSSVDLASIAITGVRKPPEVFGRLRVRGPEVVGLLACMLPECLLSEPVVGLLNPTCPSLDLVRFIGGSPPVVGRKESKGSFNVRRSAFVRAPSSFSEALSNVSLPLLE